MSDYDYYDIFSGEGLTESELEQRYDEMLDEIHGEPMGYPASRILREVDPIAYRCGFNDWLDSELGETITEDSPDDDESES